MVSILRSQIQKLTTFKELGENIPTSSTCVKHKDPIMNLPTELAIRIFSYTLQGFDAMNPLQLGRI